MKDHHRAGMQKAAGYGQAHWRALGARASDLLQAPDRSILVDGLLELQAAVAESIEHDADLVLFALLHGACHSTKAHSAWHAMACCAAGMLVARQVHGWSAADQRCVGLAALSMNVWMTAMHDELARRRQPVSIAQRVVLDRHALGSAKLLAQHGVTDTIWLEAIEHHHEASCGPLADRSKGRQVARLLQRLDTFVGGLAWSGGGGTSLASQAAKATYLGEDGKPDEAGALVIRTLGIYPPGCAVRLASGEVGVAVRRGAHANTPLVAVVTDEHGAARNAPVIRQSVSAGHAIAAVLAPEEAGNNVSAEQLHACASSLTG